MLAKSDFGQEVADTIRQVKQDFKLRQGIPRPLNSDGTYAMNKPIDRAVRETINSELDTLIKKHEASKPYPGVLP